MVSSDKFVSYEGFTFDDVLLVPAFSEVLPSEVDTRSHFTENIVVNVPICSAAMDTVTEARLAIAVAREGGLGIIHRNMPPEQQAGEVDKVKRSNRVSSWTRFTCTPKIAWRMPYPSCRTITSQVFPLLMGTPPGRHHHESGSSFRY
jgi:IMP dehydrogenase/GMP reductase